MHYMVTLIDQGHNNSSDCPHPGPSSKSSFATFQVGNLFFQSGLGWIAQTCVDIPLFIPGKTSCTLGHILKDKGRSLINWRAETAVEWVWALSSVDCAG